MLHNLPKVTERGKKRVGRGKGSNKGKTSGRGMNGQRAHGHVRAGFEGGQARYIKRLRVLRGTGFTNPSVDVGVVNLGQIEKFYMDGEEVSIHTLKEKGLVKKSVSVVKVLASGTVTKKVTFGSDVLYSTRAFEKIGTQTPKSKVSKSKAKHKA